MSFKHRRLLAIVATVVLIGATGVASAGASAGTPALVPGTTCTLGTFVEQNNPGVLFTPARTVAARTILAFSNCVTPGDLPVTSGFADYTLTLNNWTCLNLFAPLNATYPIVWRTGETSTVQVTARPVAGVVVVTGTVTAGLFRGLSYTQPLNTFPVTAPTDCLGLTDTIGYTLATGSATLAISLP